MTNRFLTYNNYGDLTDGTIDIFANSISASNLEGNMPIKTSSSNKLESTLLSISDTSGLQSALNSTIQNPLQSNLIAGPYSIVDAKAVSIKTGSNSCALQYNGTSDVILDVSLLGADVSYSGGVTSVGQLCVFNSTDGKVIKDGLKNVDQVCLTSGINMEGNIDMKGNDIITGAGLVDGVDVSTLPGDIAAKLPLAGGTMTGILDLGGYETKTAHKISNYNGTSSVYFTENKGLTLSAGANLIYMNDAKTTMREFDNTGFGITTSYIVNSSGTINAPSYTFTGDLFTGFSNLSAGSISFLSAGNERVRLNNTGIDVDTINEQTAAAGVTIDGVLLKDSVVNTDTINEKTGNAGVNVEGINFKDKRITVDYGASGEVFAFMEGTNEIVALDIHKKVYTGTNNRFRLTTQNSNNGCLYLNSYDATATTLAANIVCFDQSGFISLPEATASVRVARVDSNSGAFSVGTSEATEVKIGKAGITTTINGTANISSAGLPTTIKGYAQVDQGVLTNSVDAIAGNNISIGNVQAVSIIFGKPSINCNMFSNLVLSGDFQYTAGRMEAYANGTFTTTIAVADTWYPVVLTSMTVNHQAGFSMDTTTTFGEFTYTGTRSRYVHCGTIFTASVGGGTNQQLAFSMFDTTGAPTQVPGSEVDMFVGNNANDRGNSAIHYFPAMATNNKYRLYCKNSTSTNSIILHHINMFAVANPGIV